MTFSLFKLGCLLQLFIYSSQSREVAEDSPTAAGVELLGNSSNRTNETCLLEDSSSYEDEDEDIRISDSSHKVGATDSCVPDKLGSDMGESQKLDPELTPEILERITKARVYMEMVAVDDKYDKVRGICKNTHKLCAVWAVLGDCEANPHFMTVSCAPVCESCEQLHAETRCPMDLDAIDALYPGDLDKMFQDITINPAFQQYEPKVLSRPDYAPGDSDGTADYQLGPWMVVFDNTLSGEEADHLIDLGRIMALGYDHSATTGGMQIDGTYKERQNLAVRTSTNAWCMNDWGCYADPTVRGVMNRIANITGIPEMNSEYLQLVLYEEGQFYRTHHDYLSKHRHSLPGVRILTFFIYLNDMEEKDGGGTNFPELNLTVTPKRGRAVIWPSVLNDKPNNRDDRTSHQAMPVLSGVKNGINAWIHQRDYKTPAQRGCR